jgi:hypothetical protein
LPDLPCNGTIKIIHNPLIHQVDIMSKKTASICVLTAALFLASCGVAGGTTSTQSPTEDSTGSPSTEGLAGTDSLDPGSPTIESLFVNDLELTAEGSVYTLPGNLGPGNALELELTIGDDSPGEVTIGTVTLAYEPGAPASVTYFIPRTQLVHEIPLSLDADDGGQAGYVLFLAPEDSKPVFPLVDVDDDFEMGTTVEFEIAFADLDGDDLTISAEQYFTRGPDAVPEWRFQDYVSNFVLDIEVERTDTGARVRFDAPMPGYYALKLTVQDDDGGGVSQDVVVSVVPTNEVLLNAEIPMIGAWIQQNTTPRIFQQFEGAIGHEMVLSHVMFSSFCTAECNKYNVMDASMRWVIEANKVPVISFGFHEWDWDAATYSDEQPTLGEILDGEYDAYLATYARSLARFDYPVLFIPGWEFNGIVSEVFKAAYAFGPEGNQHYTTTWDLKGQFGDPDLYDGPERFVQAWIRIHDIFQTQGADNVLFVWNPSCISWPDAVWNTFENYWPGEQYVDFIAPSVYKYAYDGNSFDYLWTHEVTAFHADHPDVPVLIRELGSDRRGNPITWYADTLATIAESYPEIRGIMFFSEDMGGEYEFHHDPERTDPLKDVLDQGYFGDCR